MSLRGRPRACGSWGSRTELSGQPLALDGYRSAHLHSEFPGQKLGLHDDTTGHPRVLGSVARLDPAGPPDDGAPAACARWAFVAGPGRVDLGAAEPNSPEKSSCFTTMPRSVGVWLWIPPVDGCALCRILVPLSSHASDNGVRECR